MSHHILPALLSLSLLSACGDKDDTGADDTGSADTADTSSTTPSGDCAGMSDVFASADTVVYGEADGIVHGASALDIEPAGCLWMSTLGAQRFDGSSFSLFDTTNSPMVSTQIRSFEFADGLVWAAHENGQLDSFDGQTGAGDNHGVVAYDVAHFDSSGALWSTPDFPDYTIRVYETDGSLTTYTPQDFGASAVMLLDVSPDGETMWLVNYGGKVGHIIELDTTTRTATLHTIPEDWVYSGVGRVDADGTLWFAAGRGMLQAFDGGFTSYTFPELSYTQAARDIDGSVIWVGATITSATTTETARYRLVDGEVIAEGAMHSGDIYAQPLGFVVDLDGNYWISTQGGELVGVKR